MDSRPLLQRAFGLHQQGQLDQSAILYDQVLQHEPENFIALHLLGTVRGQQGRQAEALRLLEAALTLQPNDFRVLANYGQALASSGRQQEALAAFDRAVKIKPDFFEALYNRGTAFAQLNRFAEAANSFDEALKLQPENANCLYNRGTALAALGRLDDALESYDRALAANPRKAEAFDNRGNVLREKGRLDQALESYDKALALSPGSFRIHYNRAVALSDLRRDIEAVASYDRARALQPQFVEALFNRGLSLLRLERYAEALEGFDQAIALRPNNVDFLNNRGVALWHLKRHAQSLASYNQALALEPDHTASLLNRALLLQESGDLNKALADYDRATSTNPQNARAWNGRGATLHALRRDSEALENFGKALALDPELVDALTNRAQLRWTQNDDLAGAVADLNAALALQPDQPFALGELIHLKMHSADWEDFDSQKARLDDMVPEGRRIVRPFVYQALSHSPAALQACSRIFAASLAPPVLPPLPNHPIHERIRVGYFSGEFREQATAHLMAGLYELHDRRKFEIIAIDNGGSDGSPMRRRLESAFDKIVSIVTMSDEEAMQRVRAEEIDILVNLNGYFGSPRVGVFARRAAPIQVNYLGFPGTLGASYMDYILADRIVIPEAERDYYDEQVVWMPHSYQANDRKRAISEQVPDRAELRLPKDDFVFCNFNQSYKITPTTFVSWMRILGSVEGSVLWLLSNRGPSETNLKRAADHYGIEPERLIFAPPLPLDQHLARLNRADLFLDTLPCNAHTTASDALWAGLPLLTCRGTTFPGRVAASLLTAAHLPQLVTESMEDYESLAIQLAKDAGTLTQIRQQLLQSRLNIPLFDTKLFCRTLEVAYDRMYRTWQSGASPRGFIVDSATSQG